MMKWISTILEGIAGFVIWSFVGLWIGVGLATIIDLCVPLSDKTARIVCFSTATVVGLVMAAVYARRAFETHEGRRKNELNPFEYMLVFALCALAWAALILFIQTGKRH